MAEEPPIEISQPQSGSFKQVSERVRRLVATNASPFTFTGTCTYIVGRGEAAIIDPGPDDEAHIAALLAAVKGERVRDILVTHSHRDHFGGAARLAAETGAKIVGSPILALRGPAGGPAAARDRAYTPDRPLNDGDVVDGPGYALTVVATPGHARNHLCFALAEESALFSGDHVMAWSTTVIAPPDGEMGPYMASLEKLRDRGETIYWPGHGGPVTDPARYVRSLIHHRRQREAAILARLEAGDETVAAIAAKVYANLATPLIGAARMSTFAHLIDLVGRGLATCDGEPALQSVYRAASR